MNMPFTNRGKIRTHLEVASSEVGKDKIRSIINWVWKHLRTAAQTSRLKPRHDGTHLQIARPHLKKSVSFLEKIFSYKTKSKLDGYRLRYVNKKKEFLYDSKL